jgi:MFS family permease
MGLTKNQVINAGYALFSSCLEYYNYMLLMYLIPVWGKEFFPKGNDIFMKGFGIIFLTALTRPIAATLIGNIGDKFGRKRALLICACIMSISCLTIAFLPGYYQIESIAKYGLLTVVVVLCRILQIASAAGKLNGSAIFLIEHFPKHAGLISAIIWFATISGMFIASLTDYFCSGNSSWRWAVGIGGLMSFVSFFLVRFLKESNEYIQSQASSDQPDQATNSDLSVAQSYWAYIATFCIAAGISGMFYYSTSYIPVLFQKKFAVTSIGLCRGWLLAIYAIGVLLGGVLCDTHNTKYSDKLLMILLMISTVVFAQVQGFKPPLALGEFAGIKYVCLTSIILFIQFRTQKNLKKHSTKSFIKNFPITSFLFSFWDRKKTYKNLIALYMDNMPFILLLLIMIHLKFERNSIPIFTSLIVLQYGHFHLSIHKPKFDTTYTIMLAGTIMSLIYTLTCITQTLKGNLCWQAFSLLFTGLFVGPSHKIMNQLFPPNQRYKSVSLCYALATALIGGSSTFVCLKLEALNPRLPAVFMAISAGLGMFGIYAALKSRANHSGSDSDDIMIASRHDT